MGIINFIIAAVIVASYFDSLTEKIILTLATDWNAFFLELSIYLSILNPSRLKLLLIFPMKCLQCVSNSSLINHQFVCATRSIVYIFIYYSFTLLRTNYSHCLHWFSKNYSFIFMDSLAMFMLGFLLLCKSRSNTFQPRGFRFRFSLGYRYSFRFGFSVFFGATKPLPVALKTHLFAWFDSSLRRLTCRSS